MIGTVIVEDEELIRDLIRNSVDWEHLGFSIIGEAADGESALEIIKQTRPSLVILDINIPIIGGLEVARQVRSLLPRTKILILTGYERFDYAQEAIRLGVVNYLLKPIQESVLEAELNQVRDELTRFEEETLHARGPIPVWRDWRENPKRLKEVSRSLPRYRTAIIEIDSDVADLLDRRGVHGGDREPVATLEALFPESMIVASTMRERYLCVIADPPRSRDVDIATTRARSAVRTVSDRLHLRVTVILSHTRSEPEEYESAIAEVEEAANEAFFRDRGTIYEPAEKTTERKNDTLLPLERIRERLTIDLRLGQDCRKSLSTMFDTMGDSLVSRDFVYLIALETVNIALIVLNESGLSFGDLFPGVASVAGLIYSQNSAWALRNVCLEVFRRIAERLSEDRSSPTTRIAYSVRQYIEKRFQDPLLSLEQIAAQVERNPSYLSSVFKQATGISVTEYISTCRLEYAREQLKDNPLVRIQDVAERSGYYDPYYFSKAFKKHYGLSPRKYIAQLSHAVEEE